MVHVTADGRIRICLDANVLLAGALRPDGPSSRLLKLRDRCTFMVPDGAVAEATSKILENAPGVPTEVAQLLIDGYCRDAQAFTVTGFAPTKRDGHVKAAAIAAGCAVVCTYDKDDFRGFELPTWTPLRLLKHFMPQEHLIEPPMLGALGTYLLTFLTWGGDAGRILRDDSTGSALWIREDGRIDATGRAFASWRSIRKLPLGSIGTLVVRYRPGEISADYWPWDGDKESQQGFSAAKLPDKTQLGSGKVRFERIPIPGFVPHAETLTCSSVPDWIGDKSLRYCVLNQSLEVAYGKGRDVENLLANLDLRWSPMGVEVRWR